MTCIIGVADGTTVWMGADTLVAFGWEASTHSAAQPKVRRIGDLLVGGSGSVRFAQIIEECVTIPAYTDGIDELRYLVRDVAPAMREALKTHGWLHVEGARETTGNSEDASTLLIGFRGRLFRMSSDFSFTENAIGYDSIGCGRSYALGAVYRSQNEGDSAYEMIVYGLQAATMFSIGVNGEYTIRSLNKDGTDG